LEAKCKEEKLADLLSKEVQLNPYKPNKVKPTNKN
jgi:hypothetical protein